MKKSTTHTHSTRRFSLQSVVGTQQPVVVHSKSPHESNTNPLSSAVSHNASLGPYIYIRPM